MDQSAMYRIRVKGHLDTAWSDWFEGFALKHEPNGETTLTGPIVDQSALQGVLLNIGNLGLTLVAVNQITSEEKE
jgi:hypothetical protein